MAIFGEEQTAKQKDRKTEEHVITDATDATDDWGDGTPGTAIDCVVGRH
jgi:hypothetical protein